MRYIIVLLFSVSLFFSCTKEAERPVFDEIQGDWKLQEVVIEEIYDGEVDRTIRISPKDHKISFSDEGVYGLSELSELYFCAGWSLFSTTKGAYFLSNNQSKLEFDKGVHSLSGNPSQIHDIKELTADKLEFDIVFNDSIIGYLDADGEEGDYSTDSLALYFGNADGYDRGKGIDLTDYNQGYEDGYLFLYGLGYGFTNQYKSFYIEYLKAFRSGYAEGAIETQGTVYSDGFTAGNADGFSDGSTDGIADIYFIPDEVRVTYVNKR